MLRQLAAADQQPLEALSKRRLKLEAKQDLRSQDEDPRLDDGVLDLVPQLGHRDGASPGGGLGGAPLFARRRSDPCGPSFVRLFGRRSSVKRCCVERRRSWPVGRAPYAKRSFSARASI